uniref:Tenascin C n=1 Tax=Oryzias sinensis TaxID=183150 RepID=A0A8C7YZZ2_9TELE
MGAQSLLGCFLLFALVTLPDAGLVKKILRHRRQTLSPHKEHNATLPGVGHPLVFSHVYNINVPASALCSVDLEASEGRGLQPSDASDGHQVTEHTVDGESQIVFTHRISIPQQACGCGDRPPGLKELMSRLEMLEGEVSALREQCGGEAACCGAPVTGELRTKPFCSGRGNYSSETCGCVCEPGWRGPNCSEPECPGGCQDRGRCVDGRCECWRGFAGDDCSLQVCPVSCGTHGRCVGTVCVCEDGFHGDDCSQSRCLNDCLGRGHCDDGDCVCDEPWTGYDCSELICPKDCYDRGRCVNGTCFCDEGFSGEDCGQNSCPNNCRGNGACVDGKCLCTAGYSGEDCSQPTCLSDCSGRGTCIKGMCTCDSGYQGDDCSQVACPNNCRGRGQCINGQCSCDAGFQGDDCAELSCPNSCLQRGQCVNGQCVCDQGFAGEDCSIRTCPSDCYGRGTCVDGRCACHAGFSGSDCSELSCPKDCRGRGLCVDGQCICDEGFSGEDCTRRACPNDCLGRGDCLEGRCVCWEGFSGDDCSAVSCPENCSGRGSCVDGRCSCESGYEGDSCAERSCSNSCHQRGSCVNAQCVCDEGYIGEDCSEVSPPKDLTVGEVTEDTVDLSWDNEMLVTEYLVTYAPMIPGGLLMEFTVAGDQSAATVTELEPGMEYLISVYAVLSNKRSIPVSARVVTDLPQPQGLRFKSVRETSVEVVWDQLDISFDGWEIYFLTASLAFSGLAPSSSRGSMCVTAKTQGCCFPSSEIDGPQQVEVKDVTESSALVSWYLPVAPVDRVGVFYAPGSDPSAQTAVDVPPSDKQLSMDGLRPDTQYTVLLVSRSGNATSDPVTTTFTTALDAPTGLQAVSQTDNSVTLEWTNSQADVDSYRVKYSPISGAAHGEEVVPRGSGLTTQATITGLNPGTEYGMGVTAVRNERESLPATTNAATDLDPPREFERVESTETSLTVRWQKPDAKVSRYRLTHTSRDGQFGEEEVPASESTHVLRNLSPGMTYTLTLTAERGHRRSRPVSLSASTEPEDTLGTLTVSGVASDGFDLTWKANHVYDNFTVEYRESLPLGDVREVQLPGDAGGSRIRGLKASTEYQIKLYGVQNSQRPNFDILSNEAPFEAGLTSSGGEPRPPGTEPLRDLAVRVEATRMSLMWSASEGFFESFLVELGAQTPAAPPRIIILPGNVRRAEVEGLTPSTLYNITLQGLVDGRPPLPLKAELEPAVVNLTISDITWDSFTASWSPQGGDFDSFVIEVTNMENLLESQNLTLSGDALSLAISGLYPNTTYMVGLYGMHQGSFLEPLYNEATTAIPPLVGKLYITNVTSESFSVLWNGTQGHFDGLVLEIIDSDWLMEPKEFNVSVDAVSHDVTGLRPSTDYIAYLYGMLKGSRTKAVSVIATTEAEPEVDHLFVSDITADGFRLSWAADEDLFDRFVIKLRDSKRLAHPQEYSARGDERTKVITGLMSGTEYEIELYGVTLDQRSQPVTVVAQTGLSSPRGLRFSDVTDSTAVVHWSTLGSLVDNYRITYTPFGGGSPLIVTADGSTSQSLLVNMIPGKTYVVTVSAVKGLEESEPSRDTVTTALDSPQSLAAVNVTDVSALLLWQPSVATVDGYIITLSTESVPPVVEHVSGNTVEFQMRSLLPGTTYSVGVYGVKGAQKSASAVTEFTTGVDPPRDLTATNVQIESATLTWKPPQAAITGYMLSFSSADAVIREVMLSPTASSYSMSQLTGSTEYNVRLQAIAGPQRSRSVTAVFSTFGQLYRRPRDCAQILLNGETTSGLYTIYIGGEESLPIQVYCDMSTDGGGWMVFLRRQNGRLDFFRNWKNYTAGFGNMNEEFWLGLSSLHKITALGHYELRVDLKDKGESAYAQYDKFTLSEPRSRYKINIGAYSGTAGDSMTYHQGRPFSTYDNDNDIAVTNCALSYKGAFWYKNCHRVNLMGKYGDSSHSKGINWFHWKGHEHSIEFAEMKIRPANFRNLESRKKRS